MVREVYHLSDATLNRAIKSGDLPTVSEGRRSVFVERAAIEKWLRTRPLLLTMTEVARQIGCSRQTVFVAIRNGRLRATRVGHRYSIRQEDVDTWRADR